MAKIQACWGLDVSRCSVKGVKLEKTRDGIEITACDIIDYPLLSEGKEIDVNERIREGISAFSKRHKLRREPVAISLPGFATFNRIIKLPLVDQSRLAEMVRYEAQQQIPFPIEEVIWDYQIIDKDYQVGEEMEIGLFAIKREFVESFLAVLASAEINPEIVQFGPLAIYNFMRYDQPSERASLILDIGADNSDLIVVDGSHFWIRNLPIASQDITKAIQKKYQMSFAEAEDLKLSAGEPKKTEKVMTAIRPILRDLVGEIHRSIGYYKSISRQAVFERMTLMGRGSKLAGLSKFFTDSIQLKTAKLNTLNKIRISPKVDGELIERNVSCLCVAIGLALQGLGVTANRINLLPPEIIRVRERVKKRPFVGFAAVVFLVTIIVACVSLRNTVSDLMSLVERIRMLDEQVRIHEYNAQEKAKLEEPIGKIANLEEIGMHRDIALRLLEKISIILEKNADEKTPSAEKVWLTSLELDARKDKENRNVLFLRIVGHLECKADVAASREFVMEKLVTPLQGNVIRDEKGNLIGYQGGFLSELGLKPVLPMDARVDPRRTARAWPVGKESAEEEEFGDDKIFHKFTVEADLILPSPILKGELWHLVKALREPESQPETVKPELVEQPITTPNQ